MSLSLRLHQRAKPWIRFQGLGMGLGMESTSVPHYGKRKFTRPVSPVTRYSLSVAIVRRLHPGRPWLTPRSEPSHHTRGSTQGIVLGYNGEPVEEAQRTAREGRQRVAAIPLVVDVPAERAPSLESEGCVPVHVLGRHPAANRPTTQTWLHAGNCVRV